ncbi:MULTISPECIES: GNAT family N-acetyltransferase [Aminobacter]|jgi:ribosomal protein S18 acetylase RimI-like enzyme|uniref:Ribosomal protein S18 acetylase RimI-like enzyme n=1 Tax=Aminobacter ciceronei TaxID=150723 RepID=A0ABR6C035_9HYPH|nr:MULTISPECIES: GNAT family N-acetyltransferase [Aminobacter]MBA8904544.1 ribosomal protein S18 acetylase RimI-like enzyme [Aminobacter ciceronei]MBA9018322.1 ribosomal protein S18 acetylase RimI-like enzyme [Aminobacter ciceronei]MRX33026.1 GNAT family N-acetyltransferase [Aminobacter sp. MDW-2]QNH36661.1 GNAT family N-acetyltransferase [Aminobacter sp. MDW-2]QOF70596.1 GNAT family N-acetyltransferase [Aminobacter sp. SR38]
MSVAISTFSAEDISHHLGELGALLHACVHDGASIGFVLPYAQSEAEAFWRDKVLPGVGAGMRIMLVAHKDGRIAGTVQLGCDTMPNQPHRADVNKLMVHPDLRRQGIARLLMREVEGRARELGRSLLTLDTRTGDSAEPLYTALGYQMVGTIPAYARDPFGSDRLDATTVMYKLL